MKKLPDINPATIEKTLVSYIRDTFATANKENAVIGISGGVDSATTCVLTARALGGRHVYPYMLPHGKAENADSKATSTLFEHTGVPKGNQNIVDISPVVDAASRALDADDKTRKGNLMARARMMVLFDQAKARDGLVVGTENKSEHILGYYTRFGDEASDVEVIRNLYKTHVYALANHVGVPQEIIDKAPSAGLWDGQSDEGELGFSYAAADPVLYLHHERGMGWEEIVREGYDAPVVDKVRTQVERTAFKHHVPYVPEED